MIDDRSLDICSGGRTISSEQRYLTDFYQGSEMAKIILSVLIWGFLVGDTFARYGETPEQCVERYGAATTNLPGYADVDQVAVHSKDGLSITVFFTRGYDKKITAGMIFYTPAKPFSYGFSCVKDMALDDENTILATVKGQWSQDKPTIGLEKAKPAGGNVNSIGRIFPNSTIPKVTPISNGSGIIGATGEKVAKALPDVLRIIFPRETRYIPIPISHNGLHIFAFRILHGVAICSDDKIPAISNWAEYIREQKVMPASKPISGL